MQAADKMLVVCMICKVQMPITRDLGPMDAASGCFSSQAVQPGLIQARMWSLQQVAVQVQCSAVRDTNREPLGVAAQVHNSPQQAAVVALHQRKVAG